MEGGDAIEEEEAPAMFECALAELLAEGVAADVGPLVQKFKDDPASLEEAYKKLPTTVLEPYLPAYDVARDDRLRNAALSEALREFKESLPWRSRIRRTGFQQVKGGRHRSCAEASLRILELYRDHPAYVAAGRFKLGEGKYVNAAQLETHEAWH